MELLAGMLRSIVDQMGLPPLREIGRQPGVSAALRVIIRYHDRRAADSVATLRRFGQQSATLDIVYRGLFNHQAVHSQIEEARYVMFMAELHGLRFDHLIDQQNIPTYGVDLWMVERAAGNFIKGVILAPELVVGDHARLVEIIKTHMQEVVREVGS